MEKTNERVLEALQMQPLSEEEKASRHILGRLAGPIATCKEKTRNGRGYNKPLWEKALADDIFKEKLATKSLFLELGHPANREETDMREVCACIPEMPKIINDDLYAYVDILDTPNGKLLKTLCDYGFIPGISSRGSGDIMANDEVDPETFFLETWDIVQLPAVKKARLSVCESFDGRKPLKTALQESYSAANDEDKKTMKEALEKLDLGINLDEEPKLEESTEEIPIEDPEEKIDETLVEADEPEAEEEPKAEDAPADVEIDEPAAEPIEAPADEEAPKADGDEDEVVVTVGDFKNSLDDWEEERQLEWSPIVIDDKEYPIEAVTFDDSEDGKLIAKVSIATSDEGAAIEDENADSDEGKADEGQGDDDGEAGDAGDEEVIESLKEAIRQKDQLESEVRELKNQKTVSDAEAEGLKEELEKYKSGFTRVSELAAKSTKLAKENKTLSEQLSKKDAELNNLRSEIKNHTALTESANAKDAKISDLTKKLAAVQAEAEETEKSLTEQLTACRKKASDRTNLAKTYKSKYDAVVERYIASKAQMLGVRNTDIKSRLNEGFTLDDIDKVCDGILDEGRPQFTIGAGARMQIRESAQPKRQMLDPDNGYEIDDDLLRLAGLKD